MQSLSSQCQPIEDRYVGEKKNQLRHGYGVFRYQNEFYRYEGQWKNGLKHGHGKLVVGGSGFYEGTFVNGEMEGHGYKVFGISGATYTGQFRLGEMHGQGLMRKPSGEQYEGCWHGGKKQGLGILTGSDGGIYEGCFHRDLRHEQGVQIYRNGDQYEGDWITGKRHGHGMLRCSNGTIYDGQWKNDVYHGEGKIAHCSGVVYHGLWTNGNPQNQPVKVRLTIENDVIFVEQGKTFDISFECVDEDGKVVELESGRLFKVVASMRKPDTSVVSRSRSRLTVASSVMSLAKKEMKNLVKTPFGYSAVPYELFQVPASQSVSTSVGISTLFSHEHSKADSVQTSSSTKNVTFSSGKKSEAVPHKDGIKRSSPMPTEVKKRTPSPLTASHHIQSDEEDLVRVSSSISIDIHSTPSSPRNLRKRSGSLHWSLENSLQSKSVVLSKAEDSRSFGPKEAEFLESLIDPELITSKDGRAVVKGLYLPPPPVPDISHILPRSPTSSSRSSLSLKSPRSLSRQSTPKHGSEKSSRKSSPRKLVETGSQLAIKSKERLLQPRREKFCLPGTYVMIISEVTSPAFYGPIEDFCVEVSIVPYRVSHGEISIEKLLQGSKKGSMASMKVSKSKSKPSNKNVPE